MGLFGSKTREHQCSDGPRTVYKNVDDAFRTEAREWSADGSAAAQALEQIKVELRGRFQSELKQLASGIDEANRSLRESFRSVYLVFTADPCNQSNYLATEMKLIREREYRLRAASIVLSRVRDLKAAGADDETIRSTITNSFSTFAGVDDRVNAWRRALP